MWPFSAKKKETAMFDATLRVVTEESRKLGHNYIGTEHLLCALVATADSDLQDVLRRYMLSADSVRTAVVDVVRSGSHQSFDGVRPLTPRLKQVLSQVESEHAALPSMPLPRILLFTLLAAGGVGTRSLSSLGIDMDRLMEDLKTPNQSPEPTRG